MTMVGWNGMEDNGVIELGRLNVTELNCGDRSRQNYTGSIVCCGGSELGREV